MPRLVLEVNWKPRESTLVTIWASLRAMTSTRTSEGERDGNNAPIEEVVSATFEMIPFGSCSKIPLRFVGNNLFERLIGVPGQPSTWKFPGPHALHNRDE